MPHTKMNRNEARAYAHLLRIGLGKRWHIDAVWLGGAADLGARIEVTRDGSPTTEQLYDAEDVYAFITNQAYNQYINSPAETITLLEDKQQ